jgi:hypothetical protein
MGYIPIWLCAFIRYLAKYYDFAERVFLLDDVCIWGVLLPLFPYPLGHFGFDSIGLYNDGVSCLNLEVLSGPYTPNPFENFWLLGGYGVPGL